MQRIENAVKKAIGFLNDISGIAIVITMAMVVVNIILRAVFKNPLLGTYEYTGFLTALFIGLSLSYCAFVDAHIAIDFIVEGLSKKAQAPIHIFISILSLGFMGLFTWSLFQYAAQLRISGQVSPTTQTPFYIIVYILAFGFFALTVVLLLKAINAIKGVVSK